MPEKAGPNAPGVITAEAIVLSPKNVSSTTYATVIDGLGQLAKTGDNLDVRISATVWLSAAGTVDPASGGPVTGIVDRLASVYRQSNDVAVRSTIVQRMLPQAERAQAMEFLKSVAIEDRPEDGQEWPPGFLAVFDGVK